MESECVTYASLQWDSWWEGNRCEWKMNVEIFLRVTSNTLRCIDKAGGLDNYVLYTKDKDLNSDVALKLRERILEKQKEVMKELN